MKIYGQTLRDIFDRLPWQYKVVVVVGAVFIFFVMIYVPVQIFKSHDNAPVPAPVVISATGQSAPMGMLDPSIAADAKTEKVWMAYTTLEPAQRDSGEMLLHVRFASTAAGKCTLWSRANGGFAAKSDDILAPDGQTVLRSGTWRIETPTLVHDPDDKGREWKLFAYKYFWAHDPVYTLQVAQHYGMIVYKYASDPAGEWSTEQWILSPAPDYPPVPYQGMVRQHINTLSPDLQGIVAYARPSVVYKDGALVMTLSAFTKDKTPDRVIMLRSLDHGNSWQYAGTVLQKSDLAAMGPFTQLAGASLIEKEGQVYLAAVLGDKGQWGKGAFILGFDDFTKGILRRDAKTAAPVVLQHVTLQNQNTAGAGGGFAAYTEACPFGFLVSEEKPDGSSFQIFKTYQKLTAQ